MSLDKYEYALVTESDLEDVLALIRNCANALINSGLKQWDTNYPDKSILMDDIKNQTMHCCKEEGKIIAVVVANKKEDIEYNQVNWKDKSGNYIVIHRLGVSPFHQRKGIGKKLMTYIEDYSREKNINSIRLDTFSLNPASVQFYRNLNYKELERIHLPYQPELFVCFEKIFN